MRTTLSIVAIVSLFALSGCMTALVDMSMGSDAELARASDWDVADAYYIGKGKRIRAELERRGLFTPDEWGRIDRERVQVGDRAIMVVAALGKPREKHTTSTAWATVELWQFPYAWVQVGGDGRVIAVQTSQ